MDLNTFFERYRPYLAMVAAIAALIFLLPGEDSNDTSALSTGSVGGFDTSGQPLQDNGALPLDNGGLDGGGDTVVTTPDGNPTSAGSGGTTSSGGGSNGGGGGGGGTGAAPGPNATNPPPPAPAGQSVANCDPNTGRISVPTIYAPPCVSAFNGNNGGATAFGVTGDTVRVVYFQPEPDPATEAALSAAGAANSVDEQAATMQAYFDYFNAHYETYGRNVEMIIRRGSGDSTDDSVGRADALAIATEDKAFAVLGAPATNAFVDELAARGIICVCTVSQPQEFYESKKGLAGYTSLMSSTQGYVHRAEYVGKRLAGRNAVWAGTSDATVLSVLPRKFGLLWYETADGAYKAGIDFFVKELKNKYNVTLAESISYRGFPDVTATQEGARPRIQRLKQAQITSVIFSGDPIAPAIFTQEATRQQYFPEWIITGSALTDTSIFARTYAREQWDKAFGISFLVARLPERFGDSFYLHEWHHGTTPVADNQHGVIYPLPFAFFTGLHMAGPNLNVQNWINGIFSYPVSGSGRVTAATVSFGNHGLWPFTDFTAFDDVTEIWWDGNAEGEDETGARGVGLYRYVDNGKRYLPGQHPRSDPKAFDPANTVTGYDEPPPGEGRPEYPPPR